MTAEFRKRVETLDQYLQFVLGKPQEPGETWVFRGHRDVSWLPIPKLDRTPYKSYRGNKGWSRDVHEAWLIKEFKKAARSHLRVEPRDEWEWLGIAQHYGLGTRLLDWTANPLTALFFAVEKPNDEHDSEVWCYRHRGESSTSHLHPFDVPDVLFYDPSHVSPRIPAQAGCFTVHPHDDAGNYAAWPGSIQRVAIAGAFRAMCRQKLMALGITRASLFPDLDGIASHTNARFSSPETQSKLAG